MSNKAENRNGEPMTMLDPCDVARRACEIAGAELRFGRPVVLVGEQNYAALALDTATSGDFDRFAQVTGGKHMLFLTAERSHALGLARPKGVLVPLAGVSHAAACELGYRMKSPVPTNFEDAPEELAALTALSSIALLLPALVVARIEPDEPAFAGVTRITAREIAVSGEAESRYEMMARTEVPLRDVDKAEFVVFRGGLSQRDQVAIVVGDPDVERSVPIRIHSSCITGDLFGSLKCDCGDQLREGLRLIQARGGGVLIYLDQEGRGTGIGAKMMAYGYQAHGLDTIDADETLGFGPDLRRYGAAVAMLKALGIAKVELLTNNPTKAAFLENAGISVTRRTSVLGEVTNENQAYLTTKAMRAGHQLDVRAIAQALVAK
ncbi:GTP cyclohydrolase II RibA [Fulvimarina endophytica]|uniref:GTP cyclohydrolase-2 n=1 Tax=Fulvimarina endophytica TaxID=2293836 RepID=A0A371X2A0_9HYPH|nr:GTP cyclohydrolase II RibA [Fulvimarina endophytica]RFC63347.1 GTP cyclohydrolase II RibA [Fulvimarina endophytica]